MDFFAKVTLKLLINLRTGTSPRHSRQPELIIYMIYIYNNVVVEELDYLVQDIWLLLRVSRFIGSNHQATARKTVTIRDNEKLKTIHTGCGTWCCDRCYLKKIGFHNCNRLRNRYTCQKIQTSETKLQFSQRCTVIKNLFSIKKYSVQNDTWLHALNVITYM